MKNQYYSLVLQVLINGSPRLKPGVSRAVFDKMAQVLAIIAAGRVDAADHRNPAKASLVGRGRSIIRKSRGTTASLIFLAGKP